MVSNHKKVCIIGAGASGLAAAISAAENGAEVVVLEHKDSPLNKLKLTGNGKCNYSNRIIKKNCYHNNPFVEKYLSMFNSDDAIGWMEKLGIKTIDKYGYLYPESEKATDVAQKLLSFALGLNVTFKYNVTDIDIGELRNLYDSIIIATGSFAYKKTGSDGSGYKFLEKLGIHYSRVLPALCAINCADEEFFNKNHGKRIIGKAIAVVNGNDKASDIGEIQITEKGFSGIPVFNISRYLSKALDDGKETYIKIDTNVSEEEIPMIIREHESSLELSKTFEVISTARFDKSQVCTGGVSLTEIDDNMQIKAVPGVYLAGEICDVDGICGGYNLHWAWCSGIIAGKAAALC